MQFFQITIIDGEAQVRGPYPDEAERFRAAKAFCFSAVLGRDILLKLNLGDDGIPTVEEYRARDLDPLWDFLQQPGPCQQPRIFQPDDSL